MHNVQRYRLGQEVALRSKLHASLSSDKDAAIHLEEVKQLANIDKAMDVINAKLDREGSVSSSDSYYAVLDDSRNLPEVRALLAKVDKHLR